MHNEKNLGDPIIAKCTEALYREALGEKDVISSKPILNYYSYHAQTLVSRIVWSITARLHIKIPRLLKDLVYRDYEKYFEDQLKDCDAAIAVGGGLFKFICEDFSDGLLAAARTCTKFKIPFIINAIGVEGYDDNNPICHKLKKAVSQKSLISISTRDDLETLRHRYITGSCTATVSKVADPAVWSSEIYGISKNNDSKTVGLGIVRKNIFTDYGINFSPSALKDLYIELTHLLKKNGYGVELFTNGSKADNEFAREIYEELRNEDVTIKLPTDSESLLNLLSQYCGVIAGRLHSCIIAYSLDIPAVGIVWNQKMMHFARDLQISDLYKTPDLATATAYLDSLKQLMTTGYDQSLRSEHRQTIKDLIQQNVKTILSAER